MSRGRRTAWWLGGTWLVAGVLVGVAGVLLVVASDHARDHLAGVTLLVLAVPAVVVGARVLRAADEPVGRASVATSAVWVGGAVVVLLSLTFLADRLLFAGVPALVGCGTAALALSSGRRDPRTSGHADR